MDKVKEKYIYYILGVLTLLFFLFGQGVMWYAMGGDSEAYYTNFGHHIEAKPFYPLLLHVLNLILGDRLYLYAASVLQMLLAVFCIIILISTIARYLELESFSIVIIWLASLSVVTRRPYSSCAYDRIPDLSFIVFLYSHFA